jgi:hypothetical protein
MFVWQQAGNPAGLTDDGLLNEFRREALSSVMRLRLQIRCRGAAYDGCLSSKRPLLFKLGDSI